MKTDVLILGGGLAGLSTAYHLNAASRLSSLVVEKKDRVGGTAGSVERNGFVFDHSGHLLHLHDAYGKKLILSLLRGNLAVFERSSWIHLAGRYTRYPFQANTYGLPLDMNTECLAGFLKTVHWPDPAPLPSNPSFKAWCLRTFGDGICRRFMFPYNEKLWRVPLSRMTTEWQGRFVPKPSAVEVLYGALMDQKKFFGYNATFRYPIRGGISVLPDALAARLKPGQVRLNSAVLSVDVKAKTAEIEGIGTVHYGRLVNTLPLTDFIDLAGPWSAATKASRRKLKYNTVYCLNLGVARANISDKHWIYYPEKKYPFYRVGVSSNFSKTNTPKGCTSFYIEVSRGPEDKVDLKALERSVLAGMRRAGLLRPADRILAKVWIPIRCAYVLYDFQRTPAVDTIFAELSRRGVESIGRYGGWKYSFMEETILDGKRCAERLSGVVSGPERVSQAELQPLK